MAKKIDRTLQKAALSVISDFNRDNRPLGAKTREKREAQAKRKTARQTEVLEVLKTGKRKRIDGTLKNLNMGQVLQRVTVAIKLGCSVDDIHETKVNERYPWKSVAEALVAFAEASSIEPSMLCTVLSVPLPQPEAEAASETESETETETETEAQPEAEATPEPAPATKQRKSKSKSKSKSNGASASAAR
jgi:hypothetical protein